MKKKLALLLSMLSVMAISSVGFAGCNKGGGTTGSSSQAASSETVGGSSEEESSSVVEESSSVVEDSSSVVEDSSSEVEDSSSEAGESSSVVEDSSSEEVKEPSLTMSQETLALGQYESATLTATLVNAEDAIEWSSSDDTVAKVVDGVVTTYGAGEAVITATAGDLTATCTVTVTAAENAPVFTALDDEMEIIKGVYEELDLTVEFNGEVWEDVTVSVATEGDKVTVDEDEGYYGLIGEAYGTQTVTVTATWNGVTVAEKSVTVTVVEYGALIVDLPENKLNLVLGEEGYDLSNISVLINDEPVENPEFTAESSADGVAKVEDGKIVAVGAGTAEITVSYTTEQDTYDTIITVTVTKKVIAKEVNFFLQGDNGVTVAETGNVTVDLSATEIDLSKVTNVYCGDTEVTFAVDGTNLTLTNAPGGYQIYTLVTATEDYTIDGCVYGYTIDTAEELLDWRTNCGKNKAYAVLTADIDLGGITLEGQPNALGILDGMGHTVSNFFYTNGVGFVKYISAGAAIKNIQFVNAIQDCSMATSAVAMGLFGDNLMGSLENVLIKVVIKDMAETLEHYGVTVHYSSAGSVAKNIVVDVTTVGSTPKYIYGHSASGMGGETVDNVHLIMDDAIGGAVTGRVATNSDRYATEAALTEAVDFSAWNGWSVTAEGSPCMSDYTDDMAKPVVLASGEARKGKTISFKDTSLVALTYTLEGETTGITLEDKVVTIGDDAVLNSTFKVVVSCDAYPEFAEEFEYTIAKEKVAIAGEFLVKGSSTNKWSYDTGTATVDLSTVDAIDLASVTKVLLDGEEFAGYAISGSTLTLTNAPGGLHEYTLCTADNDYLINVCVYVNGISTVDELEAWRFASGYWYTVLLNDIDYEGATLATPAATEQILGTLDGRGYSIKNFTHTKGYVGGLYGADSAIKNVKFVGVTQDCAELGKYPAYGLFAQSVQGTIENVYIDLTTTNMAEGAEHLGVIVYAMKSGSTARNVVVDLKNATGNFHYAFNQNEGGTVVGVVAGYEGAKGSSEGGGAAWGVNGGFHAKLSWMIAEEANDELLTFTSPYWHIDTTARTIDLKPVAAATDAE